MTKRGFLLIDPQKNVLWIPSDGLTEVISDITRYRLDEPVMHIMSSNTLKQLDRYVHKYIKSEGGDINDT